MTGLPRTGTSSLALALSILLDGPAYHVGCQYLFKCQDESHITTWTQVLRRMPYRSVEDRVDTLNIMRRRLDGYVATIDPPLTWLIPELTELYPDALIICTTRDEGSWSKSMVRIESALHPRLFSLVFFWIHSLRYFGGLCRAMYRVSDSIYGPTAITERGMRQRFRHHHKRLEQLVPKEKLIYLSVKDGWGPLCRALDLPVPDVPFPHLNEGGILEHHFKRQMAKGMFRWCVAVGLFSAVVVGCSKTFSLLLQVL